MVTTVIASNFVDNVELSSYFSEIHNFLQSIHSFNEIGFISLIVCSVNGCGKCSGSSERFLYLTVQLRVD